MRLCAAVMLLFFACDAAWAVYGVRICDLDNSPTPPSPIKVWGKVTSTSPLRLSDGRGEIEVSGITAEMDEFVVVQGLWDGSVLTAFNYPGEMVYIPAGLFLMGSNGAEGYIHNNELPQHEVYLSGYWIGRHEVTRGEYRAFIEAGGYSNPAYWSADGWNWKEGNNRTQPGYWAAEQDWEFPNNDGVGAFTQTDNHPVVGVTYYEAEAFCNWADGHLPTEAQWEKAARWTGSYPSIYPWGNVWNYESSNNRYDSLYPGCQTAPVGSYPAGASPYGLYDVVGNVHEICKDWYSDDYYSQAPPGGWVDPEGPATGSYRVARGGCWGSFLYTEPDACRCAYRLNTYYPYYYSPGKGFRVAR